MGATPGPNFVPEVIRGGRLGYLGGLAMTPAEVAVSPTEIVVTCGPREWILRRDETNELMGMQRVWAWKFHWVKDGRLSQEYVAFGFGGPGDVTVTRIRNALSSAGWKISSRRWKSFRWGSDR